MHPNTAVRDTWDGTAVWIVLELLICHSPGLVESAEGKKALCKAGNPQAGTFVVG